MPWTREELKKLAGLNLIRVFRDVERISSEIKARGVLPYESWIPDIELFRGNNNQLCRTDFKFNATE